jgi:hypothetical protein
MKSRSRRALLQRPPVWAVLGATAALLAATGAAAWWLPPQRAAAGAPPQTSTRSAPAVAAADAEVTLVQALVQRCKLAMLQGTCAVSNEAATAKPAAGQPAQRVFVAGTGEINAVVYAELQRFGDEMCGEVERKCGGATGSESEWNSPPCRVARALYPAGVQ